MDNFKKSFAACWGISTVNMNSWAKEKEGIYFDSSTFTAEEAKQEFKEYHGTTDRGYPYTGYEYDGQKYHDVTYLGEFEDDELPHNDIELMDILIKRQQKNK